MTGPDRHSRHAGQLFPLFLRYAELQGGRTPPKA